MNEEILKKLGYNNIALEMLLKREAQIDHRNIIMPGEERSNIQQDYSNGFLFVSIHFSLDISIRDIRVGFKIFDNTERNLIRTLLTDFNHNVRDLEKGDYEVMTTVDLTGLAEGQVRVSPHFSIFGIKDFLVEDTISSLISINKPKNFNMCYPQEKTLSTLITSNQWSIQKLK